MESKVIFKRPSGATIAPSVAEVKRAATNVALVRASGHNYNDESEVEFRSGSGETGGRLILHARYFTLQLAEVI